MPEVAAPPPQLDSRKILRFFYPLAVSWLCMGLEGPINAAVIGRRPNDELNMAAFLVMFSLALFIESPVIDFLSTSTTLSKSKQAFGVIRRFVVMIMVGITAVHALFVFSPAFDWVTRSLMNVPSDVATAAHSALIIMIPWSACIGWRRYLQGILIRFGQTRWVGIGTFMRLGTMGLSSIILSALSDMPSVNIAATALICSVFAEAVFVHFVSRAVIREMFAEDDPNVPPITLGGLAAFHFPLTATTLVSFVGQPLISAALARSADPVSSMASWQVAFTLMWLTRAAVYALPEVVITLNRSAQNEIALRAFCIRAGLMSSGVLGFLWAFGVSDAYFQNIAGVGQKTIDLANLALIMGLLLPMIGAFQSFVRGNLTLMHQTKPRLIAIGAGILTLWGCLSLGVALKWPGIVNASLALNLSLLVELTALYMFWTVAKRKARAPLAAQVP